MQPIQTLDEFFIRSGGEVSLYHMGRHVVPCPRESLAAFESGEIAWPEPWQGQARLAIVFRLGDMPEPAIWFLALPLDEQGMIAPAQRDAFLNRLLETLGRAVSNVGREETADVDHLMKDNPLAFTPSVTFQAMLNARATDERGLPASQHFEPVEAYLSGQQTIDWQALGLQGIADYVVRMETSDAESLAAQLPELPTPVIHSLCYCLEHQPLPEPLVVALQRCGEAAAQAGDIETLCACLRAVGNTDASAVGDWYTALLNDTAACGPDVLAAIAGRGWGYLEDAQRLPLFLQRLAEDERSDFAAVIRDIALIPRLRLPVMMALRDAPTGTSVQRRLALMMSQRNA
ncbi:MULTISPECIES: DUF3549 family protein [unclassified Halomonas]|uniref:DUF3549 family protein n=1 Tax=unclassified Halomonas TaxID=2609666 RepID=UPI001CF3C092|nr:MULTISPECIES: DUF3549 family protein [unclassified Halomonas]MCA8866427.1 DUF3549 family protein [Halomonas sp. SBBP1]UZH08389.1 DUF3549 family protein [Halomonas sp. BDJS001]